MYKNFGKLLISFAQIRYCIPKVSHNVVLFIARHTGNCQRFALDVMFAQLCSYRFSLAVTRKDKQDKPKYYK